MVIVEGAGGLLVRLDSDGGTLLDLAALLDAVTDVEVVVVVAAGLGTLNHTELTVDALRARGFSRPRAGGGRLAGRARAWPSSATSRTCSGSPRSGGAPGRCRRARPCGLRGRAPGWFAVG